MVQSSRRLSNHALARITEGDGRARNQLEEARKSAAKNSSPRSGERRKTSASSPRNLAISVVPHEESWKVVIMTEGRNMRSRAT